MKQKRVYVSGKITGLDEQECRQHFAEAVALLEAQGHIVFDPWDAHDLYGPIDYDKMMNIDLAIMESCDAIYMLTGWEDSPGARREKGRAEWHDLEVLYEALA